MLAPEEFPGTLDPGLAVHEGDLVHGWWALLIRQFFFNRGCLSFGRSRGECVSHVATEDWKIGERDHFSHRDQGRHTEKQLP